MTTTEIDQDRARRILDTPLPDNDAGAATVREYLTELLATLWQEEECFSAKRPFGEGGWQHEIYAPLIKAGLIAGTLTEDGVVKQLNARDADRAIVEAIRLMGAPA